MRESTYLQYSEKIGLAVCDQEPASGWTLIGHGPVSYSEKQLSQYNINAIIAPFGDGRQITKSIEVPLPIGTIELQQLRRSWYQNELREDYKRSNQVENRSVQINTGDHELVSLGEIWRSSASGGALDSLRKSQYLKFKARYKNKNINLYVPCVEIFRFYYSPSSNFSIAAFSEKPASKALYNPTNREATSERAIELGIPCVTLRKSIEDSCAPYVSRIALDEYAEKHFNKIWIDTIHDRKQNPDKYLVCYPPLNQNTRWHIDGVAHGDGFFVTQIKACFGKFPFISVLYDRDNNTSGKRTKPPEKILKVEYKKPVIKNKKPGKPRAAVGDNPMPSIYTEPLLLEVLDNNPIFPYLDDTRVEKVIKGFLLDESKQTIRVLTGKEVIEHLTTALASGTLNNKNIGQLKITRLKESIGASMSIYEVMPELNRILQEAEVGEVYLYYFNDEPHPSFPEASIVPYDKYEKHKNLCFSREADETAYFQCDEDKQFLRPMAVFKILFNSSAYYLLEFLSDDGFTPEKISSLMFTGYSEFEPDNLINNEIRKFDTYGQKWKKLTINQPPKPSSSFAHRFVHKSKTDVEKKAVHIFKALKK